MEFLTGLFSKISIEGILLIVVSGMLFFDKYLDSQDKIKGRVKKHLTKGEKEIHEHQVFNEKLNRMNDDIGDINLRITESKEYTKDKLNSIEEKMVMLINSDEYDIKSYITDKHRLHVVERGWIDNYTMDNLEKRFAIYEKEGGNSFIAGLMKELRQLPRVSPEEVNNSEDKI